MSIIFFLPLLILTAEMLGKSDGREVGWKTGGGHTGLHLDGDVSRRVGAGLLVEHLSCAIKKNGDEIEPVFLRQIESSLMETKQRQMEKPH